MYSALYEPIPDMEKTLERLGLKGLEVKHDLETLDKLIKAFATHIPYENLEVSYEHHLPSLATRDLYDKIVVRKRGGYCFEMNGFFWLILRDLGFDAYSVSVYVRENLDFMPDLGHRSNIIVIDGKKYFAEVGFGGNSAAQFAVPLDGSMRGGFFIKYDPVKREYHVYKTVDPEKEAARGNERFVVKQEVEGKEVDCKELQMFRDFIAYPQEFYLPNKAVFYSPDNRMIGQYVCNFCNEKGETFTVFGDELRAKTPEGSFTRKIEGDEDLKNILKEYFGIVL